LWHGPCSPRTPTSRGTFVFVPTFARGPRLHRTGTAVLFWPGRGVSCGPAFFHADKANGARHSALVFDLGHHGDIARLTLDRREARNAIPAAGWDELGDRVTDIGRSDARVLIVQAAG